MYTQITHSRCWNQTMTFSLPQPTLQLSRRSASGRFLSVTQKHGLENQKLNTPKTKHRKVNSGEYRMQCRVWGDAGNLPIGWPIYVKLNRCWYVKHAPSMVISNMSKAHLVGWESLRAAVPTAGKLLVELSMPDSLWPRCWTDRLGFGRGADILASLKLSCLATSVTGRPSPGKRPKRHRKEVKHIPIVTTG
jgi:hypothetical protein